MNDLRAGDMDGGGSRRQIDPGFWRERRVLLTGHTGFKGAWLSLWLQSMGAQVVGLSLGEPPSEPSLYALARVKEGMAASVACDIRDAVAVERELDRARPEIVIHMAAQPLVRRSFAAPRETYETN
ncbi:MAG TPA: GDP-mannose 4,6-dehydratase, partial [Solirubrobacteraceae bacterium]|nr:GDP-mannose 4,6-dehydratase [Solirubrobacteraceae bacterium]